MKQRTFAVRREDYTQVSNIISAYVSVLSHLIIFFAREDLVCTRSPDDLAVWHDYDVSTRTRVFLISGHLSSRNQLQKEIDAGKMQSASSSYLLEESVELLFKSFVTFSPKRLILGVALFEAPHILH